MDISATIHHLGEILGRVISELESTVIFSTEELIRGLALARRSGDTDAARQLAGEIAKLSPDAARAMAAAFTVYFDLANLAEEAVRVHALRERMTASSSDTVAEAIAFLKTVANKPHAHPTSRSHRRGANWVVLR